MPMCQILCRGLWELRPKSPDVCSLPIVRPAAGQRQIPIKTQARSATILPNFVGLKFQVHNGKIYHDVTITEEMVGHKLGEFSPFVCPTLCVQTRRKRDTDTGFYTGPESSSNIPKQRTDRRTFECVFDLRNLIQVSKTRLCCHAVMLSPIMKCPHQSTSAGARRIGKLSARYERPSQTKFSPPKRCYALSGAPALSDLSKAASHRILTEAVLQEISFTAEIVIFAHMVHTLSLATALVALCAARWLAWEDVGLALTILRQMKITKPFPKMTNKCTKSNRPYSA